MRLKHGAFRHLRMAAKGAALGTRHLLKKVDENFEMDAVGDGAAAKTNPKGASGPQGLSRLPFEKVDENFTLKKAGENMGAKKGKNFL